GLLGLLMLVSCLLRLGEQGSCFHLPMPQRLLEQS
ncbi:hypothetical protein D030_1409B, partial [Vibrio parahaemolyticus AQ3810]